MISAKRHLVLAVSLVTTSTVCIACDIDERAETQEVEITEMSAPRTEAGDEKFERILPAFRILISTEEGARYVWGSGSWSWRNDASYQSWTVQSKAWVTDGPNRTDPPFVVDTLYAAFSSVCHSRKREWHNVSTRGFRAEEKHNGPFPPGKGMCFPQDVCFTACATIGTASGCGKSDNCH
jgi:hypothetical protein